MVSLSGPLEAASRRTVGLRDIPLVFLAPRRLLARVEDVTAWGWPFAVLLAVVTLIGYATIQTGLIDREVDRQVRQRMAEIDQQQRDVVQRSELRDLYDRELKTGEFEKLLTRMRVVGAQPATALATALLVAAVLYGVVALTGRKPEWHTLLTICVYAGFIDALRLLVTLALMLSYRTLEVDTSLALLLRLRPMSESSSPAATAMISGLLTALDPFRVWYWLVVGLGLSGAAQLPGWRAWVAGSICWLAGAGGRGALAVATLPGVMGSAATGG